jgi:hypothetical protein
LTAVGDDDPSELSQAAELADHTHGQGVREPVDAFGLVTQGELRQGHTSRRVK